MFCKHKEKLFASLTSLVFPLHNIHHCRRISIEFEQFWQLNNKKENVYLRSFIFELWCTSQNIPCIISAYVQTCAGDSSNGSAASKSERFRQKKAFKHIYCRHRTMMAIFISWLHFFRFYSHSLSLSLSIFFFSFFSLQNYNFNREQCWHLCWKRSI